MWRLRAGEASTRHRHESQTELYVLLEGTGRAHVDGELLTVSPLSRLYPDGPKALPPELM